MAVRVIGTHPRLGKLLRVTTAGGIHEIVKVWRATVFFALLTAAGCGQEQPESSGPPFIHGRITQVDASGGIVVEASSRAPGREDKAFVRLSPGTRYEWHDGRRAHYGDLVVGREAAVWISGPIAESYPVQVYGQRVVLRAGTLSDSQ